jgi:hypothetical protein
MSHYPLSSYSEKLGRHTTISSRATNASEYSVVKKSLTQCRSVAATKRGMNLLAYPYQPS